MACPWLACISLDDAQSSVRHHAHVAVLTGGCCALLDARARHAVAFPEDHRAGAGAAGAASAGDQLGRVSRRDDHENRARSWASSAVSPPPLTI